MERSAGSAPSNEDNPHAGTAALHTGLPSPFLLDFLEVQLSDRLETSFFS